MKHPRRWHPHASMVESLAGWIGVERRRRAEPQTTERTPSEEQRRFLQSRLALEAKLIFLISFLFWVYLRLISAIEPDTGMTHALRDAAAWWHLSASLVHGAVWLGVRGRDRPAVVLRRFDEVNTILPCFAYGAMGVAGLTFDIEFAMTAAVMLTVLARAIIVPSSGVRTLVISVIATTSTVLASAVIHRAAGVLYAAVFASITLAWVAATSALATVASGLIFGLRRQIRKALQLGQYTLIEKIGEGGMGVVYRANHAMLRRPTAVKLLLSDYRNPLARARFEREVQLTARLTHPNTVTVFDYGRTPDGVFYYVMEYLDGADLAEVVDVDGEQPPSRVVAILRQVASALREAHAIGLIHRDIKPSNVILTSQGGLPDVAKVLDFGLVKDLRADSMGPHTRIGEMRGTPQYLTPEMISDPEHVDPRSDLYSLAAVGYFLLTGEHVFTGASILEVCSHHLESDPVPASIRAKQQIPEALDELLLRCLSKAPEDRPRDASALIAELDLIDVAPWGTAQAELWWDEFGESVRARRARTATGDTETIVVDFEKRTR